MSYDDNLADRIRSALSDRIDVAERASDFASAVKLEGGGTRSR